MAYRLLLSHPMALHLLRSKLKHIIVDEYQDMSVSQHALLRLLVRGVIEEDDAIYNDFLMTDEYSVMGDGEEELSAGRMWTKRRADQLRRRKLPILLDPSVPDRRYSLSKRNHATSSAAHSHKHSFNFFQTYNVPILFCAGDVNQSIYGWRGAAPLLTVGKSPCINCYFIP